MHIFVLSKSGRPLMPTKKPGKVRRMLRDGRARIVGHTPFTIQLTYETSAYTQPIKLGIDAGYLIIGYSAITDKEELIGGMVEMLARMSERLTKRAMYRCNRRGQKRYRKPRFNNRRKPKGWLAPSIQHKLDTHFRIIEKMRAILPITSVTIEVANFDIQQIKNLDITGKEYQQGERFGFSNLREYILHRDNHGCQNSNCKNRTVQKILQVHHIGYWKGDRSDRPGNLLTLCTRCHTPHNHQKGGFLYSWQPQIKAFRAATFMTTVRWRLIQETEALPTFGYITKSRRRDLKLEKSHHNDAFVIAGGTHQPRVEPTHWKQRRRNNRSLETFKDAVYIDTRTGQRAKGAELHCGRRTRNRNLNGENLRQYRGQRVRPGKRSIRRQRYSLRRGDIVLFEGEKRIVRGVHSYGRRVVLETPGKPRSVGIKKVVLVKRNQGLSIESDTPKRAKADVSPHR